jgi:hypothetical protein
MPLSIDSTIALGAQPDGWSHRELVKAERLLRDNSSNGCRSSTTQRKAFCRSPFIGSAYRPRELSGVIAVPGRWLATRSSSSRR